jgi:integrase
MGYSRIRNGRDGKPRYTAYYWDIRGRERSAGTYGSRKEADKAWRRAEAKVDEGRAGDPRRGRQTFQRYVEDEWLPGHVMELRTLENYTYYLDRRILPEFGPMRMVEILPVHVRQWVTKLATEGAGPSAIKYCMVILSAIFTTALNDQVTFLHPCKGVKTPAVPKKTRPIITPEQFDALYAALLDDIFRLLAETDIESGLRWGELTELRVKDLDFGTQILTVSRVVIEVSRRFHPEGGRFLVKHYPKDKEHRRLKLSGQIAGKIHAHVIANGLGPEDLLFAISDSAGGRKPHLRVLPDPGTLGFTDPNPAGRQYRHGTLSGYSAGKCRCRPCTDAYTVYRARRRAEGKDQPRQPRALATDGHIPRSWFRTTIWKPALQAAGLAGVNVRANDMRHAHASWLLAGGADLQVVRDRLGHGSISTTEKYLHTLPTADETALNALAKIRDRTSGRSA